MFHSLRMSPLSYLLAALVALLPLTSAQRVLESKSLNPCMANSSFSATLFHVSYWPDNRTLDFNIVGVSEISGNITATLKVFAYGLQAFTKVIDPCTEKDLAGLCPMNTGQINLPSNAQLPPETAKRVPGIAFTVPDLDGRVQVYINDTNTNKALACVEAELSNNKTVYQLGVAWTTAVIAGLGLVASAITSGLGHSNTAAHVAANALSLFGYFQAQAFIGMTAVSMPPIARAWTQNFQWSMGIIRVGFLQHMCTWYQRATGGTPSTLMSTLATTSVRVQKRAVDALHDYAKRAFDLSRRTNNQVTQAENLQVVTVTGIKRVGFRAGIEATNIFLTGYSFFIIFVILVILGVVIFKWVCESLVKAGKMKGDKFQDFRNGWTTVLKGILFRIVLIGFPQMVVLCFWELTVRDSAAEVVLALSTLITMIAILAWAALKVWRIAQRSISMHKNPAYILYSDPVSLNKWGFLYVQFKATAYYFIVPILFYLLVKGMFIGLGQGSPVVQAVALVIIECALLITVCIMKPYMDKKTNAFNISIASINFVSAIFLLIFTGIFNQPGLATGIMGVLFFAFNAVFAFVLLLMVIWASGWAVFSKNPDTRYQPMRDDRGSFIKSQTQLNTELDALGATARGDKRGGIPYGKPRSGIDDDDESYSGSSVAVNNTGNGFNQAHNPPRSPVDPSVPLFPGTGADARHGPPPQYPRSGTGSPVHGGRNPGYNGGGGIPMQQYPQRPGSARSHDQMRARQANNASPWQRGVGFE